MILVVSKEQYETLVRSCSYAEEFASDRKDPFRVLFHIMEHLLPDISLNLTIKDCEACGAKGCFRCRNTGKELHRETNTG